MQLKYRSYILSEALVRAIWKYATLSLRSITRISTALHTNPLSLRSFFTQQSLIFLLWLKILIMVVLIEAEIDVHKPPSQCDALSSSLVGSLVYSSLFYSFYNLSYSLTGTEYILNSTNDYISASALALK